MREAAFRKNLCHGDRCDEKAGVVSDGVKVESAALVLCDLIRVERTPSGQFVAHGPNGITWMLKRLTEEAARVDGADYLFRHYMIDIHGRWVCDD
jgi:hypothetical protein